MDLPLGARIKPRGIFEDEWSAGPSPARPWPVILIHGTCDTKGIWHKLGPQLRHDGWAVFAPDYGLRATQPLAESARQLGAYIEAVLAVTGAEQVILVGHSQGGLLARYWMRVDGGAAKVRHLVCLSAPNHGTTAGGIASRFVRTERQEDVMRSLIDAWFGPAGMEQVAGSEVLAATNRDGDLEEGVTYTCIATRSDAVVVPPETCFLDSSTGAVRNIFVQDYDRRSMVAHEDMPLDRRVRAIVRTALAQISPAQISP
ncbi:lipase family alpha/beta hydrolase [Corynebacterium sp.]|uniref:lipase family alpha/beta hydrolase n=1 Tax=Corynebacterium sp. TaxID=1720 RepID=UPI0034C61924